MTPWALIPLPWRIGGLLVLLALVGGYHLLAVHQADAAGFRRGSAEVQGRWDAERVRLYAVAASAAADYRNRERELQARVETAEDRYARLQTEHARALVAQRDLLADRGRLRDEIAAYAAGSGRTAPDTVAAASERAATLGVLLAEALRADAESAAAAEGHADAVRALLNAWPSERGAALTPRGSPAWP